MVEVLKRAAAAWLGLLLLIGGLVGLDAAGEYVMRPSQAEIVRRAAEQCARTLAFPTWGEVSADMSPEFHARFAADRAVSKFECTYGKDAAESRRLRERLGSLDGSLGQLPEGFAACSVQAEPARVRIERMRDGYAKSVAVRDWTRWMEECYDRASRAHERAREAAYIAIIRETGF